MGKKVTWTPQTYNIGKTVPNEQNHCFLTALYGCEIFNPVREC